ncbi:MAG: UDP-2,3-diacylglucosamine diphosphatase [Gallionellales bacterium RBG_16_57_15]|nr:MAG: UDP-2,3-diacylglucosamine diphosphatase [Gallionellales bacterium RBG_16_57_15]
MPHTLFISDLHLSADHSGSMAAFQRFIAEFAPQAEALYILGDLFEYWAGDDDLEDEFHARVIAALRGLAQRGTRVYLLHGNRDLLMGKALAEACRATLLHDPTLLDLYGTPTLVSHGDRLCTGDTEYQRYRARVHDADFQRQFLARPLAERKAYIEQLRSRSTLEKQSKDSAIMDVNDAAVAALLREYRYPRLIHGHTHQPGCHQHRVDGHNCERWVLGDWHQRGSALRCDEQGCAALRFDAPVLAGPT